MDPQVANQKLFDHVLRVLRKQGRPAVNVVGKGENKEVILPLFSTDGCCCAVGSLFKKHKSVTEYKKGLQEITRFASTVLVSDMRIAHDDLAYYCVMQRKRRSWLKLWESRMSDIATKYHLKYKLPKKKQLVKS